MSSNADLCARCGFPRREHVEGYGEKLCPTMTFVEPSTTAPVWPPPPAHEHGEHGPNGEGCLICQLWPAQPPQRPGAQPEAGERTHRFERIDHGFQCRDCDHEIATRDLVCNALSPLPVDQHPGAPGAETP